MLSAFLTLASLSASAQYKSDAMVGVRAGVSMGKMTGVPDMLVSKGVYSGYSFSEDRCACPSAGVFLSYRIPKSPLGLEARISYDQLNSSTTYSDIEGFTYTMESMFHTVGASAHIKVYPYKGLYLAGGIGYGWNLTPDKFTYKSNSEDMDWGDFDVPTDEETQDEIVQAFHGNSTVHVPLALGYDFPIGLNIEAQYLLGLNDMLATSTNRHDFGDTDNRQNLFGLLVGWAWPVEIHGSKSKSR